MIDSLIFNALIGASLIALIAGPLGCFVVWRRMAYFGDSLSHSALLGIALGIAAGVNMNIGIVAVCVGFAVLLTFLQHRNFLATDTILGILAHSSLSIGIVVISLMDNVVIDIHSFLFGDVLTISNSEILMILAGVLVTYLILYFNWSKLVLVTISEDMAKAEGINLSFNRILTVAMVTIIVAVSIRVVGVLLITSLLIIPAATSRQVSKSPLQMAVIATIVALLGVWGGIITSVKIDAPSGPMIVVFSTIIFAVVSLVHSLKRNV